VVLAHRLAVEVGDVLVGLVVVGEFGITKAGFGSGWTGVARRRDMRGGARARG
jgi:hypothetical protein